MKFKFSKWRLKFFVGVIAIIGSIATIAFYQKTSVVSGLNNAVAEQSKISPPPLSGSTLDTSSPETTRPRILVKPLTKELLTLQLFLLQGRAREYDLSKIKRALGDDGWIAFESVWQNFRDKGYPTIASLNEEFEGVILRFIPEETNASQWERLWRVVHHYFYFIHKGSDSNVQQIRDFLQSGKVQDAAKLVKHLKIQKSSPAAQVWLQKLNACAKLLDWLNEQILGIEGIDHV